MIRGFIYFLLCLLALPAQAQLLAAQSPSAVPEPVRQPTTPDGPPGRPMEDRAVAVLQVLDKVSARTTKLRVPVGTSAAFGLMFVTVRSCRIAPPSEPPEASAFVEINEVSLGRSVPAHGQSSVTQTQPERLLFSGWMFASSPALSALEHPTYDVIVIGCEARAPTVAERAAGGEEGPRVMTTPTAPTTGTAAAVAVDEPAPLD